MKKDYYHLEDIAKELNCEVSDLTHHASKGELILSVLMAGDAATLHLWDSNPHENEYAEDLTESERTMREDELVEPLWGAYPLTIREAREFEAGRLEVINSVGCRSVTTEYSEWSLIAPLKKPNFKIVINQTDFGKFKNLYLNKKTVSKAEWKELAWKLGYKWMIEKEKETGQRPSTDAIAKYVEGELSNRNITGVRGKFLDKETIKREALTGITGRARGENIKVRKNRKKG